MPDNYETIAKEAVSRIRERFKKEKVTIVVNADQTFVKFLPAEKQVIAPKGAKRVGGTIGHVPGVA